MITISEWKSMSGKEQTLWLEENKPASRSRHSTKKLVLGVGSNDSYCVIRTTIDGCNVKCQAYRCWENMLTRCYSKKFHLNNKTYIGVKVCEEWLAFSNFKAWWLCHQVDDFALDKDILGNGDVYSPETCLFIPQWLNNFIVDHGEARGDFPIGACYEKQTDRYRANCRNPITSKHESIGRFTTPEAAHLAWRTRKLELALELKPRMDSIDLRIYPRVIEIINNAK